MANKENPRRKGEKRTDNGPRWEGPQTDRNSARARAWWKRTASRSERRSGTPTRKYRGGRRPSAVEGEG